MLKDKCNCCECKHKRTEKKWNKLIAHPVPEIGSEELDFTTINFEDYWKGCLINLKGEGSFNLAQ
jgi:hypothetical protein